MRPTLPAARGSSQLAAIAESLTCTKIIFFFKQKTAYEILSGLVGSEMCIRDRNGFGINTTMKFDFIFVHVKDAATAASCDEPLASGRVGRTP